MSLTLATLPVEILAQITSDLTHVEVIGALREVGNSLLTSRLKRGGVTHLTFNYLQEQSPARIDFIRSLELESFSVLQYIGWDADCAKILIHGLSRNLKRLAFAQPSFGEGLILVQDEIDHFSSDSSDPFIFRNSKYLPWNVSASYPQLRSLKFLSGPSLLTDKVFLARFLAGLPSSITDLKLPLLGLSQSASIGTNLNRIFPPNITRLVSHVAEMPIFSQNLLDSLTSLRLDLANASIEDFVTYPPHLTQLTLSAKKGIPSKPIACPNLTSLTLHASSYTHSNTPVIQLLDVIPHSLTSLTATGFRFVDEPGGNSILHQRINLRRLNLSTVDFNSRSMLDIMRSIPNIEEMVIYARGREPAGVLMVEHFEALHGRSLTKLDASIASECFKANETDATVPLSVLAPRLKDLEIRNESMSSFDFGTIPNTVTRLIVQRQLDVATLHRLPPSVKVFEGSDMISATSDLPPVFIPPTPPPSMAQPESDSHSLEVSPSFDMALGSSAGFRNYVCEWRPTLCPPSSSESINDPRAMIKDDGSMVLGASTSASASTQGKIVNRLFLAPLVKYSPARKWQVCVNWPNICRDLPASITKLFLDEPYPETLPHLHTLIIDQSSISSFDLTLFPVLTTLVLKELIESMTTSPCPPNLTSLTCHYEMTFPPSFLPLPTSMKIVKSSGYPIGPISALENLPNLSTLTCPKPNELPLMDWLKILPSSMSRIKLRGVDFNLIKDDENEMKKVVHFMAQRFTSLRILNLYAPLPTKVYRKMIAGLPQVDVRGGTEPAVSIREPAILATRLGYTEGSLILPKGLDHVWQWSCQARPDYLSDESIQTEILSINDWNEFVPLVSPECDLSIGLKLDGDLDPNSIIWPPSMTHLHLASESKSTKLGMIQLPNASRLVSLTTRHNISIDCLPPTLTKLCTREGRAGPPSIKSVMAWPPNLRYLKARIATAVMSENLRTLPQSLETLGLGLSQLSLEQAELIPAGLAYYEADESPMEDVEAWIEFLKKRKILWLNSRAPVGEALQKAHQKATATVLSGISRQ